MTTAAQGFCVKCGRERAVDPISHRCLTCGQPTSRPQAELQNLNGTKPDSIKLPASNASRRWLEQTRALAEGFAKAASEAEERAQKAMAEAKRLREAAAAFTGLLPQVSVDEGLPKATRGRRNGRWSLAYERCVVCGRVDRPHASKGRCTTCQKKPADS